MMMNYPIGLFYATPACCVLSLPLAIYILYSNIISRTSIGSTSDLDSSPSRPETRTIKRKSTYSNSSSSLSMKTERKNNRSNMSSSSSSPSIHLKTKLDNDEDERSATVTKTRHSDDEILHISTPDIHDDTT